MSIKRKMTIFVMLLIIMPMTILFFSSSFVLNEQIKRSEQSYLDNALKIVRITMFNRKEEMRKAGHFLVQTAGFQDKVRQQDRRLLQELQRVHTLVDYLDVAVILRPDKLPLTSLSPFTRNDIAWDLNGLVEKARESQQTWSSEETFPLDSLFYPGSDPYNRFRVKIMESTAENTEEYLTECQIGITVIPIIGRSDGQMLGFLVLGDITNNDDYFPTAYSQSVKESYLALSVGKIRVTSNIRSGVKENYIGSAIPVTGQTVEGPKNQYFGRVQIGDEIHVFLDEAIVDNRGNVIGMIGVGIPEEKFSAILATNRNLILVVSILCLNVMLVIGRYLAASITQPILLATSFAERLSNGERELVLRPEWLADKNSETTILLATFQKMARELKVSEDQRKQYLEKLQQEQCQQLQLAQQLKNMNDELETKVQARTQGLQQAITALKKADVVKSQFLANMSHELRTPLNAIICSSEAILDNVFGPLNDKQAKYLQNILASGTHLLQLINDILDISKLAAGKMKLSCSEFYIGELVENSFNVVKSLALRKNITVSIVVDPADFKMKADAQKLKQILYNLLSNAIKFTPEGGSVRVEVNNRGPVAQISVRDDGIGIKAEDQERVFREFEQVDSSYARQYEGTGLGLPLTKKLVEMQGGQIYLKSKLGHGTEVMFTIPIDTEAYLATIWQRGTMNGENSGC